MSATTIFAIAIVGSLALFGILATAIIYVLRRKDRKYYELNGFPRPARLSYPLTRLTLSAESLDQVFPPPNRLRRSTGSPSQHGAPNGAWRDLGSEESLQRPPMSLLSAQDVNARQKRLSRSSLNSRPNSRQSTSSSKSKSEKRKSGSQSMTKKKHRMSIGRAIFRIQQGSPLSAITERSNTGSRSSSAPTPAELPTERSPKNSQDDQLERTHDNTNVDSSPNADLKPRPLFDKSRSRSFSDTKENKSDLNTYLSGSGTERGQPQPMKKRSMSLCSQKSGLAPDEPLPPLPLTAPRLSLAGTPMRASFGFSGISFGLESPESAGKGSPKSRIDTDSTPVKSTDTQSSSSLAATVRSLDGEVYPWEGPTPGKRASQILAHKSAVERTTSERVSKDDEIDTDRQECRIDDKNSPVTPRRRAAQGNANYQKTPPTTQQHRDTPAKTASSSTCIRPRSQTSLITHNPQVNEIRHSALNQSSTQLGEMRNDTSVLKRNSGNGRGSQPQPIIVPIDAASNRHSWSAPSTIHSTPANSPEKKGHKRQNCMRISIPIRPPEFGLQLVDETPEESPDTPTRGPSSSIRIPGLTLLEKSTPSKTDSLCPPSSNGKSSFRFSTLSHDLQKLKIETPPHAVSESAQQIRDLLEASASAEKDTLDTFEAVRRRLFGTSNIFAVDSTLSQRDSTFSLKGRKTLTDSDSGPDIEESGSPSSDYKVSTLSTPTSSAPISRPQAQLRPANLTPSARNNTPSSSPDRPQLGRSRSVIRGPRPPPSPSHSLANQDSMTRWKGSNPPTPSTPSSASKRRGFLDVSTLESTLLLGRSVQELRRMNSEVSEEASPHYRRVGITTRSPLAPRKDSLSSSSSSSDGCFADAKEELEDISTRLQRAKENRKKNEGLSAKDLSTSFLSVGKKASPMTLNDRTPSVLSTGGSIWEDASVEDSDTSRCNSPAPPPPDFSAKRKSRTLSMYPAQIAAVRALNRAHPPPAPSPRARPTSSKENENPLFLPGEQLQGASPPKQHIPLSGAESGSSVYEHNVPSPERQDSNTNQVTQQQFSPSKQFAHTDSRTERFQRLKDRRVPQQQQHHRHSLHPSINHQPAGLDDNEGADLGLMRLPTEAKPTDARVKHEGQQSQIQGRQDERKEKKEERVVGLGLAGLGLWEGSASAGGGAYVYDWEGGVIME